MVVKIMVPFWIPIIIWPLILRVPPKRDPDFDNHPYKKGVQVCKGLQKEVLDDNIAMEQNMEIRVKLGLYSVLQTRYLGYCTQKSIMPLKTLLEARRGIVQRLYMGFRESSGGGHGYYFPKGPST